MTIFSNIGKITPLDDKTNIKLDFKVPDGIEKLTIKFSYSPKVIDDKTISNKILNENMKKYSVDFATAESFLPILNFVTLSFDENGEYRGACHRHQNEQVITISSTSSTCGIINRPLKSGDWDVVLNVHFAGCDIDYSIEIDGEAK
jgi:hypothetical protein